MEGFIKIARVAVTEHIGNHLNRKFRVFEQQAGFFHALFEEMSSASSGDPQNERKLTPSVLSRGPGTGQRGSSWYSRV